MRLLIVGLDYEPDVTGIAPYTSGVARHWASLGHHVRVAAGVPYYPEWRPKPSTALPRAANPSVRRYRQYIPKHPRALGRSLYEATFLLSASRIAREPAPDVVIGIVPSLSGAIVASLVARRHRIPMGIVFQDLVGSAALQSGYQGGHRLSRLIARVEFSVARRATAIAVVAESFRPPLVRGGVAPSSIVRVRNWAPGAAPALPRREMRHRLGWDDETFVCLHAGNMGQKQAISNLLDAAVLLRDTNVVVALAGDGNDRRRLADEAQRRQISNVEFIGLQSAGLFQSMLGAADVLLVNQRASVTDFALPSKLSAYFAAGRPVIAAVTPQSETGAEMFASGGGTVVPPQDPAALAAAVVAIKKDASLADRYGRSARRYMEAHLTIAAALRSYDGFLDRLRGSDDASATVSAGSAVVSS